MAQDKTMNKIYLGPYAYLSEQTLNEDLRLGKPDKRVILAFTEKKSESSRKLETDGKNLEGLWMGGKNIAWWENDKIHIGPITSRAVQTVVRALRREAPKNWFAKP